MMTLISAQPRQAARPRAPGPQPVRGWADVRLAGHGGAAPLQALISDPALAVVVRPDRVIAAVATKSQPPHLPWNTPAATAAAASPMTATPRT